MKNTATTVRNGSACADTHGIAASIVDDVVSNLSVQNQWRNIAVFWCNSVQRKRCCAEFVCDHSADR